MRAKEKVSNPVKTLESTFVTTVTVLDPDTKLPVEVEIRKLESGEMVGLDGSSVEDYGGFFSPYKKSTLFLVPDDEPPIADEIKQAHVIMLNDYPEMVFVGTEEDARKKMDELEKTSTKTQGFGMVCWHVKTVPMK